MLEQRGAELVAAYRAGGSIKALAAGAGVSFSMLQKDLISEGVTLRPGPGRARMVLGVRGVELVAAYKPDTLFNVLTAETGITFRTLRRFLIGEGVALRHDRGRRRRTIRDRDSRG